MTTQTNVLSDLVWNRDEAQSVLESDEYCGFVVYPAEEGLIIQVRNPGNDIFFVDMLFTLLHNLPEDSVYAGVKAAVGVEDKQETGAWELVMPWSTLALVSAQMQCDIPEGTPIN